MSRLVQNGKKTKLRTATVFEIHKQVYLGYLCTDFHHIWFADRYKSHCSPKLCFRWNLRPHRPPSLIRKCAAENGLIRPDILLDANILACKPTFNGTLRKLVKNESKITRVRVSHFWLRHRKDCYTKVILYLSKATQCIRQTTTTRYRGLCDRDKNSVTTYNTIQYILFQATRPISSKTNTKTHTHKMYCIVLYKSFPP